MEESKSHPNFDRALKLALREIGLSSSSSLSPTSTSPSTSTSPPPPPTHSSMTSTTSVAMSPSVHCVSWRISQILWIKLNFASRNRVLDWTMFDVL